MGKGSVRQTKLHFKLPHNVRKSSIVAVYTTCKHKIGLEGYTGRITVITSEKEKPRDSILCRCENNSGKAWVQVKV